MTTLSITPLSPAGSYALNTTGDPALVAFLVTLEMAEEVSGKDVPLFVSLGDQPSLDVFSNTLDIAYYPDSGRLDRVVSGAVTVRLPKTKRTQVRLAEAVTAPANRVRVVARQFDIRIDSEIADKAIICRDVVAYAAGADAADLRAAARLMIDAWKAEGSPAPSAAKPGFWTWSATVLGVLETAGLDLDFLMRRVAS